MRLAETTVSVVNILEIISSATRSRENNGTFQSFVHK